MLTVPVFRPHPGIRATKLVFLLPCLLGACGQADVANAGTPVGQPALQGFTGALRPGLYHIVQTGDAEEESERCFTAAHIASGAYVPAQEVPKGWTVERNRLGGGVIDFAATGPSKGRMTQKGSYTANGFKLDATLVFDAKGEAMSLNNRQTGTFVAADCSESDTG